MSASPVRTRAVVLTVEAAATWPAPALAPDELARCRSLRHAPDRQLFVAARALAWGVLQHAVGRAVPWHVEQRCSLGHLGHGTPRLPDMPGIGISWAHAPGVVAAAVSEGPVGIDVERVVTPGVGGLAGFDGVVAATGWTRMEASVKAGLVSLDEALDQASGAAGAPVGAGWVGADLVAPGGTWVSSVLSRHATEWMGSQPPSVAGRADGAPGTRCGARPSHS